MAKTAKPIPPVGELLAMAELAGKELLTKREVRLLVLLEAAQAFANQTGSSVEVQVRDLSGFIAFGAWANPRSKRRR